jgi:citrate lyase subunit beta/citryl-CoA lyase
MALPRTERFVPGDCPERFAKAHGSGADAVVIDLEDAVAPPAKVGARDTVRQFLAAARASARERIVIRINDESTAWHAGDLALLRSGRAGQVMLPKTEKAEMIGQLCARCPGIAVLALVETARGVLDADAIAFARRWHRTASGRRDHRVGRRSATAGRPGPRPSTVLPPSCASIRGRCPSSMPHGHRVPKSRPGRVD